MGGSEIFTDPRNEKHLDAWLERQCDDPCRRAFVKQEMLRLAATDPEYWWNQSYWNWLDRGLPDAVRRVFLGLDPCPEEAEET